MAKKIFLIAGEASGDSLGAALISSLRSQSPEPLEFSGVGGPMMEAEGFESLLPMEELCVMGLWEVVSQLPRLMKLINGVVAEIEAFQPDLVVTIDLPDFNFEVGQRLKKRGRSKAKLVHYVAPSVWAWRPGRAKKIAKFLDGIMCLFPFEPAFFAKHKLKAQFVGHPLVDVSVTEEEIANFREQQQIEPGTKIIGLFLGSRPAEMAAIADILKSATRAFKEEYKDMLVIVPTLPSLEFDVCSILDGAGFEAAVVANPDYKWPSFASCHIGLAVSGTVGLELAYLGVPHVIAYKVHPVTAAIVRLLIKVKYAHLANILLGREVVPEYLQMKCESSQIAKGLFKLMKNDGERVKQQEAFKELRAKMGGGQQGSPSDNAARFVLDTINKK